MVAEWTAKKYTGAFASSTVKDCIERYITAKEPVLSPSTVRGYRIMQRNHFDRIGLIPLKYLTDEDLQSFVSEMSATHSAKTVCNSFGLLISAIAMFSDRRYRVTLPTKREPVRHIPTDAAIQQLMDKAPHLLRVAIALAAIGTLRAGEVCAITYGDIDRTTNIIHVHADMVKTSDNEWILKPFPKTSTSDRYIPLPQEVIDLIGDGEPDARIYPKTPSALSNAFNYLRDKLGMKCRFHDLRHYAASIMHALGIPDVYIMERGGWKSDGILKSVYRNALSDQSVKFADQANKHFAGLF